MKSKISSHTPLAGRMSLTTFFAISFFVLIAAVVLLGIGYYRNFGEKARAQRKIEELEAKTLQVNLAQTNASLQASLTLAQNKQSGLLQTVRNTTNAIGQLLTVVVQLNDDLTEMKTSDAGREISPYPDLVAQAKKLYEDVATDVAPVSEVITRLEAARRVEQQLLASSGTAYSPDAAVVSSMQDSLTWAASQNAKATQYAALLSSLQREGKVKVSLKPITKRSSLEQAMNQMSAADAEARNKIILDKTSAAKVQAAGIEGEAKAENIIAQAQSIQTAIQTQTESVRDMSKQMKLRAKASRPDIRFQLAAFLSPGYYTPYAAGARLDQQRSFDQKPMSYGRLQELGALSPTLDGLNTFVVIGAFNGNDRPRLDMRYNNVKWLKDKVLFEKAKQLQALMIELGPTFVDMKAMEP